MKSMSANFVYFLKNIKIKAHYNISKTKNKTIITQEQLSNTHTAF